MSFECDDYLRGWGHRADVCCQAERCGAEAVLNQDPAYRVGDGLWGRLVGAQRKARAAVRGPLRVAELVCALGQAQLSLDPPSK